MLTFPSSLLSRKIIEILSKGSYSTKEIILMLKKQGLKVTVQGVYKAIRTMKKDNIIILTKKQVLINQTWLQDVNKFIHLSEYAYRNPISDSGNFLRMQDGESIVYTFKNSLQTDIFWNHLLYLLFDAMPEKENFFCYASHCWFLIARRNSELELINYMNKRKITYIFTVGSKTELDKAIAKDFDGVNAKYHMLNKHLFISKKNYLGLIVNIFGDYIIETQFDKDTTNKIENFYKSYNKLDNESIAELQKIISLPGKIKFEISKDKKKALQIRKTLSKNFYFSNIS